MKVAIAIPSSLTTVENTLLEKTLKVGLIGRAAAIFRIDEILIYLDKAEAEQDGRLMKILLEYMDCPQYLRKLLFPIMPELKMAGILPPLRTPHHPDEKKGSMLKEGSFREGVVLNSNSKRSLVEIGIEKPVSIEVPFLPKGKRLIFRIVKPGENPLLEVADRSEIKEYWGYKTTFMKEPLGKTLKEYKADLVISTSKYGQVITDLVDELRDKWRKSNRILIVFGSPTEGLREILRRENLNLEDVSDFVINTIPEQGTKTVRTEEAIYSTLAILNAFVRR